jgi:16S rRNA (guanine966-N2)-methyltransferase
MRIVGGAHRGRTLVAPKGHSTRPTADRTRQALFNVLEHAAWSQGLRDVHVLDLFAGSGALGLEAVSRGASSCLLIDSDSAAAEAVLANILTLREGDRCQVRRLDATRLGPATPSPRYDLAFLDPPYGKDLAEPTLAALRTGGWLAPEALVVVERGVEEADLAAPGFETLDHRDWGAARVWFLRVLGLD